MYKVTKRDCPMFGIGPYVCEFICDAASDVSTLPTSTSEGTGGKSVYDNQKCASGSIAIVAENGSESKQYMLNNQDIWCPYSVAAGSSGGGSSGSSITVDFVLSNTSENPVANKVIVAALDDKANVSDVPNIKVNEAVNADTVNGHSVNADVPENAKFTDTIPDLSPYAKKTDIPTELPANGGDADTVDGKHASDFKAYQRYAPIYIGDLLDMTEMGTYSCCVPEVTNLPSDIAQWCYVTMIQFRDAGYRRYICVPLNNAVTDANELYLASEYVRDSEGKLIWRNISDGGTAYTISEWGTRTCPDLNDAELGFSAASGEANSAPNTFWSTILTAGQTELYRTQIAFPWGFDRNSQKIKYRSKDNGNWNEWAEIYTSGNKPYITGSATVAANSQICVTNHGFIPSAVIWWESAGLSGVAPSFNDSQFIINVISTDEITINYLMFK